MSYGTAPALSYCLRKLATLPNVKPEVQNGETTNAHETQLTIASLGLIAEHLNQPVYAKNAQLEFVLLNTSFCSWVGHTREDLIGKTEGEMFDIEFAAPHETTEREVLDQRLPVTAEEDFPIADSGRQRRPTTKLPLADANGVVTHVVCVVGQAGETAASAKQLEQELERYAQERTRALRDVQDKLLRKERLMVLGQLAAGLAHQIRNPLGAIANALALARRQLPKDANPMIGEALQIANDEIWEANRIIGDLLDYARIRPPRTTETSLRHVLQSAIDSEPIPDSIEVTADVPDISVWVDEAQVRDALRNLIRNAREAMPQSGTLSFRADVAGPMLELHIQDTGEGVPEEHRNLLFEPLVTSKPLGIGLGLPTARALIVNQGGTLECVESGDGGACFLMRLPLLNPREDDDAD